MSEVGGVTGWRVAGDGGWGTGGVDKTHTSIGAAACSKAVEASNTVEVTRPIPERAETEWAGSDLASPKFGVTKGGYGVLEWQGA